MAATKPGVWGIDVGQCALKAIRLERTKEGQIVATAFDYIEHPKILNQPDADPDQLTRESLQQFLSRNKIRHDQVVISVPGQSGLARFVKLPPVEEKKVAEIVRFEAKQQIPFPLDEVVWDYQKLSKPAAAGEFAETEIGLFAMKRDLIKRAIQQFKEVGVEVQVIQMAPLALCNYLAYDLLALDNDNPQPREEGAPRICVVALDIGTDSSNLVITDGDRIIWQRPIPLGGNHFTRALTKDLKLTFAKAEHLKRNAAKSPDLRKILSCLKTVLNDFVGEVQRSLGYFSNTHRDAQIKYMVGLGNAFRLPGLQKFLQEKLQLEIVKITELKRTTGDAVTKAPTFVENILTFAVPYGLALQGLNLTRLQTNLLPSDVRFERIIRAKKPWAVMAAASLLLAVAGLAFSKSVEKAVVTDPRIKDNKTKADNAAATAKTYSEQYKRAVSDLSESLDGLNRISAGVRERQNWQLLHEYINMSLPMPNGERLSPWSPTKLINIRQKYFDDKAKIAFDLFEKKRFQLGAPLPPAEAMKVDEEKIKPYLVQVNIESISSMYSDDLGPYFTKIHADGVRLLGMDPHEIEQVLEFAKTKDHEKTRIPKTGWVVEIRGYSYHEDLQFVENTVIENLKFPTNVDVPGTKKKVVLSKDMEDMVKSQIGYMFLYKVQQVKRPTPGNFEIIGRSYLPTLVKSRGSWNRIGHFNQGGGGGGGAPPEGVRVQPRTEFVILFVWKEPMTITFVNND